MINMLAANMLVWVICCLLTFNLLAYFQLSIFMHLIQWWCVSCNMSQKTKSSSKNYMYMHELFCHLGGRFKLWLAHMKMEVENQPILCSWWSRGAGLALASPFLICIQLSLQWALNLCICSIGFFLFKSRNQWTKIVNVGYSMTTT